MAKRGRTRSRYERLIGFGKRVPTPEDVRSTTEEREKVRSVLAVMESRQAELLVLKSHGLSYDELAAVFAIEPTSCVEVAA